ncbi:hypothetical protein ABKV19_014217 [Rosa sericea]
MKIPSGFSEKAGNASVGVENEQGSNSKPLKEKTTKAERRAIQEAQRAAKAAAKGEGKATSVSNSSPNSELFVHGGTPARQSAAVRAGEEHSEGFTAADVDDGVGGWAARGDFGDDDALSGEELEFL